LALDRRGNLIGKEMSMVTRKKATGQAKGKKLRVKKETLKDLGAEKKVVKGGAIPLPTDRTCSCFTCGCHF
jgi:hypothetical protein